MQKNLHSTSFAAIADYVPVVYLSVSICLPFINYHHRSMTLQIELSFQKIYVLRRI